MDLTPTYHTTPYAAISPSLRTLSQANRTVLITGGGSGIGLAISSAFVAAGAARLIILGRRQSVLDAAEASLARPGTEILLEQVDVGSVAGVAALWARLAERKVDVDVMVLNAAITSAVPDLVGEGGPEAVAAMYEFNVMAQLRMVQAFLRQGAKEGKAVVNISSAAVHLNPHVPGQSSYATTKAAFASLVQYLADDVQVEQTQMVSFHPGIILTAASRASGVDEDSMPWDDGMLLVIRTVDWWGICKLPGSRGASK